MKLHCTFFFLITIYFTTESVRALCYSKTCRTRSGKEGCRMKIGLSAITEEQCCESENAVGFSSEVSRLEPGCFKCDSCVDIMGKVDGEWGNWGGWEACSVTCGGGIQKKRRRCDSPPPSTLGKPCEGEDKEGRICGTKNCPIHGKWGAWSRWSHCSATCGRSEKTRTRKCNNPPPRYDGDDCPGKAVDKRPCKVDECPIDGGWTDWSPWSKCSKTCDPGTQTKTRSCTNPEPQHGGKQCKGKPREMIECLLMHCPIDGGWSVWSDWSACIFVDCENPEQEGFQTRSRTCTNPLPQYGGKMCKGRMFDYGICSDDQNCPRAGGLSDWDDWECKSNLAIRKRYCDNPPPANGGKDCTGKKQEIIYKSNAQGYCNICRHLCKKDSKGVWRPKSPEKDNRPDSGEVGSGAGPDAGSGAGPDAEDGSGINE